MFFTAVFALFTLLGLVATFGVTYKGKGLKAAFIATGIVRVYPQVDPPFGYIQEWK